MLRQIDKNQKSQEAGLPWSIKNSPKRYSPIKIHTGLVKIQLSRFL